MPRSVERFQSDIPGLGDWRAWRHYGDGFAGLITTARLQGYSPSTLGYVDVQVDSSGILQTGGGGGGGGSVTQGTSPWVVSAASLPLPAGASTEATLAALSAKLTNPLPVSLASAPTTPVTGTFWQATQPVSAASLPLPSGAATDATLTNGNLRVGGSVAVTGAFFQATQPVSGSLGRNWALGSGTDTVSAVQSGAWTDDVTDRAARLVGTITNTSFAASQGSGAVTTPSQLPWATDDSRGSMLLEELLSETRRVRLGIEILIGEEVTDEG